MLIEVFEAERSRVRWFYAFGYGKTHFIELFLRWDEVFKIIPEFRILRLTFHRLSSLAVKILFTWL